MFAFANIEASSGNFNLVPLKQQMNLMMMGNRFQERQQSKLRFLASSECIRLSVEVKNILVLIKSL